MFSDITQNQSKCLKHRHSGKTIPKQVNRLTICKYSVNYH